MLAILRNLFCHQAFTDAALLNGIVRGGFAGGVAHFRIRPPIRTTNIQIVQDRAGDNRHTCYRSLKANLTFFEIVHHAISRSKPECRTPKRK